MRKLLGCVGPKAGRSSRWSFPAAGRVGPKAGRSSRWSFLAAGLGCLVLGCNASSDDALPKASSPGASGSVASASAPADAPAPPATHEAAELPTIPPTSDRYIQYARLSDDGETLLLFCGYACLTNPTSQAPLLHLWKLGAASAQTIRLPPDVDMPMVASASLSASGQTLLVGLGSNDVAVLSGNELLHTLHAPALYANALLAPDERRILSASVFGEVRLTDRATGRVIRSAQSHNPATSMAVQIAWSASGDRAVYASEHREPVLLNGVTGKEIAVLTVAETTFHGHSALQFLPHDGGVLVGTARGLLAVFDSSTGKLKRVLRPQRKDGCDGDEVNVALSRDGRRLALATSCGDAAWIELSSGVVSELYSADGQAAGFPVWSANGERLVLSKAGSLVTVDVASGEAPTQVAGSSLVTIAEDGTLVVKTEQEELMAIRGGQTRWTLPLPDATADIVADARGRLLFITDGRLELVRVEDGKHTKLELVAGEGAPSMKPRGPEPLSTFVP